MAPWRRASVSRLSRRSLDYAACAAPLEMTSGGEAFGAPLEMTGEGPQRSLGLAEEFEDALGRQGWGEGGRFASSCLQLTRWRAREC